MTAISQPIRTNAGGVPQYNNSPVIILTETNYSVKVLDRNQSQVYYIPSSAIDEVVSEDATVRMQTVNLKGGNITIVKTDNSANVVRIIPDGANTIMGLDNYDLFVQYESVTLRLVNGVYIIP
jgi:hypothetical protein